MHAYYQLCSTPSEVEAAVSQLRQSPRLIIDCQGHELGSTYGTLACIGISDTSSIYLFDVQSPAMAVGAPSMQGFLDLISKETVTKIMWDCSRDVAHLHSLYGVKLHGVLDLQLAEIMARGSVDGETEDQKLARLQQSWSAERNINCFKDFDCGKGIHMQKCVDNNRIISHVRSDYTGPGSVRWKNRPIPVDLLRCAMNEIFIIHSIHSYARRANWITPTLRPVLMEQGTRLGTAIVQQTGVSTGLRMGCFYYAGAYIPLDVLIPPEPPLAYCGMCYRMISLRRFGPRYCELCSALGIWILDNFWDVDDTIAERQEDYQLYRGTYDD